MLTQTIVVRFLSERQLVVVGGFVGGVGMILSFFAPSVYTLYVTIGVLYGECCTHSTYCQYLPLARLLVQTQCVHVSIAPRDSRPQRLGGYNCHNRT